jgi:DNA modification methylase
MMRNIPEVRPLPIGLVTPYAQHARVHPSHKRRKLEALIRRFGQVTPILVDGSLTVVDGHAVLDAMKALGYEEIMAVVTHGQGPAEIRALRLALNRIAQEATWDDDRLHAELTDLLELGFDLQLTGFDSVEIDMVLSVDDPSSGVVEEASVEDLEPSSGPSLIELGSVWTLGRHSIACGDARDDELIRRIVDGRRVAAVFADPPYNVPIAGFVSGLGRVRHGDFAMACGEMSQADFTSFLVDSIAALKPALTDGAILFVCMDWRHMPELLDAGERIGLELKNLCVWTKPNAGMGSFYRSQHELVFVWKHGNAPHQNHFELGQHGRSRSNVWPYRGVNTFGRDRLELLGAHPTVKPVMMIADALKDVTRRGDLVMDPFLGSGSTLIAAEEIGRTCIGVELQPGYIEVAIRRWQRRTGQDATDIVTGETFDAYCERKRAEGAATQADPKGNHPGADGCLDDEREGGDHG